ncbi:arginine deiminase [Porphyromonadaceae bacterium OttesenSCG-928-L07]|nr:arginine deiminase [Porphyromonadaceae bacterium OttesenSCG-928-L07]MDL2252225.1 arginine deiminase [Odoribacter sp. OttesenSCG-928-J03]MDL2283507.1 arginine deiminase [Odoribacter sp. OttesenSCG-928-G04]
MQPIVEINVQSEIGKLNGVILHTPGEEVENMTPGNAERALYSDIINLSIAREEYKQLHGVLSKLTRTYEVRELLHNILLDDNNKKEVLNRIEEIEPFIGEPSLKGSLKEQLMDMDARNLSRLLIEGVEMSKDNLTKFLSKDWYALRPMHNFFFTRDASMSMYNEVLIGSMANAVRDRESVIMRSIFDFTPEFKTSTLNLPVISDKNSRITCIEGGDVLIAREDILLIGNGSRTSSQAIDALMYEFIQRKSDKAQYIIVQQLPHVPESFIHLDMVFTFLDKNKCMAFEPLILNPGRSYQTVTIKIQNGKLVSIKNEKNILSALKKLGMDLEVVSCGGDDEWNQEREQWHSGANFFCVGPGQVVGYGRNNHTIEAMNKAGFDIIKANDFINGKVKIAPDDKFVITIDGSELPRGGGGARCMTMPVNRDIIEW